MTALLHTLDFMTAPTIVLPLCQQAAGQEDSLLPLVVYMDIILSMVTMEIVKSLTGRGNQLEAIVDLKERLKSGAC